MFFVDDGISGTSFERRDFQRMQQMVEAGQINTIIVKDLSRFGREQVEAISDFADFVRCYESVFLYMLAKKNNALKRAELQRLKHTVQKGQQRIMELDRLIEKIYEGNAHGQLSDERYTRMMASYEKEQKNADGRSGREPKNLGRIRTADSGFKADASHFAGI